MPAGGVRVSQVMLGLCFEGNRNGSEVVLGQLTDIDGAHTMMTHKRQ